MDTLKNKSIFILPNLFTTGSLLAGFLGIIMAVRGRYELAAGLVIVSLVLDGLDGKIARLTGATSDFGVQYDSLADLIAFGVNPALLVYFWALQGFGRLGYMAAFLFVTCGALRLARFNIQTKTISKIHFIGLPIPAAGCTLAMLVLFASYFPGLVASTWFASTVLVLVYLISFLMVSKIRYYSFKEFTWFKAHRYSALVTAILVFVLIASEPKLFGFLAFFGYAVFGPIYTFLLLPRRGTRLLRESGQELS
jgi:CDP-diacylglycerol--serine O-phosphatidyltransferase